MTDSEWTKVRDYLLDIFPRAKFSAGELRAWKADIVRLTPGQARKYIDELKRETEFPTPELGTFRRIKERHSSDGDRPAGYVPTDWRVGLRERWARLHGPHWRDRSLRDVECAHHAAVAHEIARTELAFAAATLYGAFVRWQRCLPADQRLEFLGWVSKVCDEDRAAYVARWWSERGEGVAV